MNETTPRSSSDVFAILSDDMLKGIIAGIEDGTLDLPEISADTLRACLRKAQAEVAKRKARQLLTELGPDHPRAFIAMLEYVELADPGATERALKESGINLPEPTHIDDSGTPFYASEALADALDIPHGQVMEGLEKMYELAPEFAPTGNELHRLQ